MSNNKDFWLFSAWFFEGEQAKKEKPSEVEPFATSKHLFS